MFGHGYFGSGYFGPGYFGPSSGLVRPPTQGAGPGWNLFHPVSERKRKADTLEADLRRAFERADEAETPRETKAAVRELKQTAAKVIAAAETISDTELTALAGALASLAKMEVGIVAYLENMRAIIKQSRKQEADDQDAMLLMAMLL